MAVKVYLLQSNLEHMQKKSLNSATEMYNTNRSKIMTELKKICGNDVTVVNSMIESPDTDANDKVREEIQLLSDVNAVVRVNGQSDSFNNVVYSTAVFLGANIITLSNVEL